VRSAKCKGSRNSNGTQRVESIGIGERLILQFWLRRIARSAWLPMVGLDARYYGRRFGCWKATLG